MPFCCTAPRPKFKPEKRIMEPTFYEALKKRKCTEQEMKAVIRDFVTWVDQHHQNMRKWPSEKVFFFSLPNVSLPLFGNLVMPATCPSSLSYAMETVILMLILKNLPWRQPSSMADSTAKLSQTTILLTKNAILMRSQYLISTFRRFSTFIITFFQFQILPLDGARLILDFVLKNWTLKVQDVNQYWYWLENVLIPNVRVQPWYNGYPPYGLRGYLNDRVNRIIGYAIVRQTREELGACK